MAGQAKIRAKVRWVKAKTPDGCTAEQVSRHNVVIKVIK